MVSCLLAPNMTKLLIIRRVMIIILLPIFLSFSDGFLISYVGRECVGNLEGVRKLMTISKLAKASCRYNLKAVTSFSVL